MPNRGGQILRTGQIGTMECIRQQMMLPGETLKVSLQGSVKMEMLRERDALRINAHLAVFLTPIRWLWSGWPQYIKDGPTGATSPPMGNLKPFWNGLGGSTVLRTMPQFWEDARFRIYNEWYKWPEDPDSTNFTPTVNLEHSWTRCRDQAEPDDAADREVTGSVSGATATLSIQDIAEQQAAFRSAVQREVLSYERYMEVLKEAWGADGSREVDQVPIKVHEVNAGIRPRSMPATNHSGLGQWGSMYDFSVDDGFTVTAPEHCILSYMLVVRLAPITDEVHPLANDRLSWQEMVGDPSILAATRPQQVEIRDVMNSSSSTSLGYLPAGWQWRSQNNFIDERIVERESFPIMKVPTTAAEARNAEMHENAFRSQALKDFLVDIYAGEYSSSAIPNALSSFYVGMGDAGKGNKNPYPKQGKVQ
jgi:hypothetical protein